MSMLFRAVQALAMRIFVSFWVELISLSRFINDSTDSVDSLETVSVRRHMVSRLMYVADTNLSFHISADDQDVMVWNLSDKRRDKHRNVSPRLYR